MLRPPLGDAVAIAAMAKVPNDFWRAHFFLSLFYSIFFLSILFVSAVPIVRKQWNLLKWKLFRPMIY